LPRKSAPKTVIENPELSSNPNATPSKAQKEDKARIKSKVEESHPSEFQATISMGNSNFRELGTALTILSKSTPEKIGVLELSTKAVKLLIGNIAFLKQHGFDFGAFKNVSEISNTGDCLDLQNYLNIAKFQKQVLPIIQKAIAIAREHSITHLYSIATAAYRNAVNIQEVLEFIQKNAEINICVVAQETEAKYTLAAFLWSSKDQVAEFEKHIVMIDQGGGSTQICWFCRSNRSYEVHQYYTLDLGTVTLRHRLSMNSMLSWPKALAQADGYAQDCVRQIVQSLSPIMIKADKSCFSVGSAITKATGKKSNREQHLTRLPLQQLQKIVRESERALISQIPSPNLCKQELADHMLDDLLVMRLGLPMYISLMNHLNIPELIVSGTALRYGLFWEKLYSRK